MASAYVFPDTAASLPLISTRRMTHTVARSMTQTSPSPKLAPAAPAVARAPASIKPPVAVRIPSVRPRSFFTSALRGLLELLVSGLPELEQCRSLLGSLESEFGIGDLQAPLGFQ